MAYAKKYTLEFRDLLNIKGVDHTNVWTVNIYSSGFVGSSTSVTASDKPITLNYKKQDVFAPLIGSELTIELMATAVGQYDEFLNAGPLQYYVDVLKNGSTWWSGVNTTDNFTQPYSNAPYKIALKFNCGLGELQWRRYENSNNLYTSNEQIIQIISNCLSFLPYTKNAREIINIREDTMSDSSGLLEQLYLMDSVLWEIGDDGATHGLNCNKLLSQLLTSLNCRMYQSNNTWYVERIYERTGTSLTYFDYTLNSAPQTGNLFTHSATGTLNVAQAIDNTTIPRLLSSSEVAATQKYSSINYEFIIPAEETVELIPNPFFEDNPTAKNSAGLPLRWDIANTFTDEKIEIIDKYQTNFKYRFGFSFGTQAAAAQDTYMKANGFKSGSIYNTFTSQDGAHAVNRTGDTYTQPTVWVDTVNGSIQTDIRTYVQLQFKRTSTGSVTSNDVNNAVNNAILLFEGLMKFVFIDYSGNKYFIGGNLNYGAIWGNNIWIKVDPSGNQYFWWGAPHNVWRMFNQGTTWYCGVPYINNTLFNQGFTVNGNNIPTGKTAYTEILSLMQGASSVNDTFVVEFRPQNSQSWNFPPSSAGGYWSFDFWAYPPIFPTGFTANTGHFEISVIDYALNCVDIQYKDSYAGASEYNNFYTTSDIDQRWGEKKIQVYYGDTTANGYIGAFRLSSGNQTSTWHAIGGATGQILADLLFSKAIQIVGQYRRNIKGKLIGAVDFWQTVTDVDPEAHTINYMPTGAVYDIKAGQISIDMEEMSDSGITITPYKGKPTTGTVTPVTGGKFTGVPTSPIHFIKTTPFSKTSPFILSLNSAYPI